MAFPLDLGRSRLMVLPVVPGRAGEARRVESEFIDLDPRIVAVETTAKHALDLRARLSGAKATAMPFALDVSARHVAERFRGDADDPFFGVARQCQRLGLDFVPLLPATERPGFFARRRVRRALAKLDTASDEAAQCARVQDVLRAERALASSLASEDAAAAKRLADLLFHDEVSRLILVATAPRIPHLTRGLADLGPARPGANEAPREQAVAPTPVPREYPAYR